MSDKFKGYMFIMRYICSVPKKRNTDLEWRVLVPHHNNNYRLKRKKKHYSVYSRNIHWRVMFITAEREVNSNGSIMFNAVFYYQQICNGYHLGLAHTKLFELAMLCKYGTWQNRWEIFQRIINLHEMLPRFAQLPILSRKAPFVFTRPKASISRPCISMAST